LNRVSTVSALILDIYTQRKVNRLGKYVKPLDDQATDRMNDLKPMRARTAGYEAPKEQADVSVLGLDEQDVAYHSPYATK
jgi:hypothetical protein